MYNSDKTEPVDQKYSSIHTLPFVLSGLLILIGSFLQIYSTWGFNIWGEFSKAFSSLIIISGRVIILLTTYKPIGNYVNNLILSVFHLTEKFPKVITFPIVSTGILWLFLAFRSKALIYGDGYYMVDSLTATINTELVGQERLQFLSIYIYRWLTGIIMNNFNTTPELTIGIINGIGGLIGFWGIYFLSKRITVNRTDKLLLIFIMLSSGATLLFFGHIENYTWPVALSLWMMYFTIGFIKDKNSATPMFLFVLLATLWHIIMINTLVLSILALIIKKYKNLQGLFKLKNRYLMIIAVSGLFIIVILNQTLNYLITMGYSWILVKVWPTPNNNYWFLSPAHMIDILNLLFFLMPSGLMIILLFIKKSTSDSISILLGWYALIIFLEIFWIDPLIGTSRDWDLLAFAGFPLSAWAGYKFIKNVHHLKKQGILMLSSAILILMHISPHVYEKHNLDIATSRLDRLLWNCPHYQIEYDLAYRCLSWGAILQSEVGRPDLAHRYFRRRIEAAPDSIASALAWFGISDSFMEVKQYDSAVIYLRQAVVLKPNNIGYLYKLGMIYTELNQYKNAVDIAKKITILEPNNDRTLFGAGVILIRCNQPELARKILERSHALNSKNWDVAANIGVTFLKTQQPDSVIFWTKQALDLNPTIPFLYINLIKAYTSLNQPDNAREVFNQYKKIEPDPDKIKNIEQIIFMQPLSNNFEDHQ